MMLALLTETEGDCLDRSVDHLAAQLGDDLVEVWVFGSVARGESWPPGMKIPSDLDLDLDLDLAVVVRRDLADDEKQSLVNATYPLYLECGRQISPAVVLEGAVAETVAAAIATDGVRLR